MTARVVVVGDALIDEVRDHRGVREFVGGAAVNVAVGVARLGGSVTLLATVGDDEAGEHVRAYLRDFGVALVATPSVLGTARAVSVRADGEPAYEFDAAAKARRIRFGEAERAALAAASAVAISGFAFDDIAQVQELTEALDGAPGLLAIDPNPRPGLLRDRAGFVQGLEALAARAALVKLGLDDATLLYGTPLDAASERMIALGAGAVLATEGAAGATVETETVAVTHPVSALPGAVVDTMGAGDATFAVTVRALADGMPEGESAWAALLAQAMDVAAATCRFEGGLLRLPSALRDLDLDAIGT